MAHAHFGGDACSRAPYFALTAEPLFENAGGSVELPDEHVTVLVELGADDPDVLDGEYPAEFEGTDGVMGWQVPGTVTFLEPFVHADDPPVISARLHASAPDWELLLDVIALRCDGFGTCSCPCE